jgi:hypothetical protein
VWILGESKLGDDHPKAKMISKSREKLMNFKSMNHKEGRVKEELKFYFYPYVFIEDIMCRFRLSIEPNNLWVWQNLVANSIGSSF